MYEKKGSNQTFDCALHHVNGRYIFLCDQDDVWLEGKIEKCMSCFTETKADLIMHDGYITDSELNYSESKTIFSERRVGRGLIKNSVHCSYHGCCMAMTDNLCEQVLPLPEGPFFHDMWIGEVAELLNKKIIFLDDKCILYRRHGENCSGTEGRTFYKKVRERLYLAMRLFQKYMWSKVR